MMMIIKELLVSFIIFYPVIAYDKVGEKKRVCIIGAGRAGLAAIKLVADQIKKFEPIAFDRNADVGGLWIYTDETDLDEYGLQVHSAMYKNLKTNFPKEMMVYPDFPFITSDTKVNSSSISHETFLKYLKKYAKQFLLLKYIQFNTFVKKITPLSEDLRMNRTFTRWRLKKRNLKTNKDDEIICDAIMICNGHFSKPNIPDIPGVDTFRGKVMHSRSYRKPEEFAGKTVIILGSKASGIGIAADLSPHAKKIYLSTRYPEQIPLGEFKSNVKIVSEVMKVKGNEFTLKDESKVSADVLIFCTGYLYDFPFLDESSGITNDGRSLHPLYRKFINDKYPSMAFIGLGRNILPQQYYSEVEYFLETLKEEAHEEVVHNNKI